MVAESVGIYDTRPHLPCGGRPEAPSREKVALCHDCAVIFLCVIFCYPPLQRSAGFMLIFLNPTHSLACIRGILTGCNMAIDKYTDSIIKYLCT